jgi:hypothetical protein
VNEDPHDAAEAGRLEGRYANYFKIGHNAFEFVLDFGQSDAENRQPRLHTRIVTSPPYAKALWETLGRSIAQCEQVFGRIPLVDDDEDPSNG